MSALFKNQAIELTALNPTVGGAQDANLLCPVRVLKGYLRATENLRHSDQLLICYGGPKKWEPLSKQRLAHWVVGVIILAVIQYSLNRRYIRNSHFCEG